MKRILSLVLFSFFLLTSASGQSATDVLNDYVEAIGGAESWAGVESLHQQVSVSVEFAQGVIVLDIEIWNIYPGYMAMTTSVVSAPAGIPDIGNKVFVSPDGAWMENAQGRQDITGNLAAAMGGNMPSISQPLTEVDILASMDSVSVELTGQEDVGGKPAHVISIGGATPSRRLYDVESGLLVAIKAQSQMGELSMSVSDYQDVDGLLKAFIQQGSMGQSTQTQAITLFEVDVDLTVEELVALVATPPVVD